MRDSKSGHTLVAACKHCARAESTEDIPADKLGQLAHLFLSDWIWFAIFYEEA